MASTYTKHIKCLAAQLNPEDFISSERTEELLASVKAGVHLIIDGNAACALLGLNLREGEAEFVTIEVDKEHPEYHMQGRRATVMAFCKLTARCYPDGTKTLPYNTVDHPLF